MDAYHIALFLHIVTLIVAASATAITKLAVGRRIRARTAREALEWHEVLISASKLFPICLALFLATGAYMVSIVGARGWSAGFVIAGLLGVVLLLASGTFLGLKAKGLKQVLERAAGTAPDAPAPRLVPPPLVAILPAVNTGIALSVVFDMVTKPVSVSIALSVVGVGVVSSAAIAWLRRPAPARAASLLVPNEGQTPRQGLA
jgi:hypothetical protein